MSFPACRIVCVFTQPTTLLVEPSMKSCRKRTVVVEVAATAGLMNVALPNDTINRASNRTRMLALFLAFITDSVLPERGRSARVWDYERPRASTTLCLVHARRRTGEAHRNVGLYATRAV